MPENKKLLLVDDEVDFRNIMSKFFSRRQIGFELAGGCMEALDWLGRDEFDVVIMDVSMPGLDGLECMAEMQKIRPDLEVIILTGHASINAGLVGMKKGAFDYCLKPVDFDELFEKIILAREKAAGKG
jgi:DNA-binding NtrC family response regulator